MLVCRRASLSPRGTFLNTGARRAFVSSADLAFRYAAFVAVLHVFAALLGLAPAYGVARHGSAICQAKQFVDHLVERLGSVYIYGSGRFLVAPI